MDIGIKIYTAMSDFEAAQIETLLKENGIPSYRKEQGAGSMYRMYAGVFGGTGIEIYVPKEAEDLALALLTPEKEDDPCAVK